MKVMKIHQHRGRGQGWGWRHMEEHPHVCTWPMSAHVHTRVASDEAPVKATIQFPSPCPVVGNPFPRWGSQKVGLGRENSWDHVP